MLAIGMPAVGLMGQAQMTCRQEDREAWWTEHKKKIKMSHV